MPDEAPLDCRPEVVRAAELLRRRGYEVTIEWDQRDGHQLHLRGRSDERHGWIAMRRVEEYRIDIYNRLYLPLHHKDENAYAEWLLNDIVEIFRGYDLRRGHLTFMLPNSITDPPHRRPPEE